ncbi:MAG TPA: xanthine dehydrogenase family protein subunit M [Thermoleophilia bacterium]|nr:xanthine dehydrogenase family protein subunit M [Thermoleophilia bacterium]
MKPGKFDYFAPSSLEEALGLLDQYGDDAKVLAGGQSLMPLIKMRLAMPAVLVDINRIPGLDYIREQNGEMAIGSLTRHRSVGTSTLLASKCPLLPSAAQNVADVQVRNRGTFGGSVTHCDPAAEFPSIVRALGGTIVCTGSRGTRELAADEFILGMLATAIEPTEIVTEVRVPNLLGKKWSHRSIMRRHGDFAVAGAIVVLTADADGKCRDVHIGMYGVGPTPLRARQAEGLLEGKSVGTALLREVAEAAADEADPPSDLRGSADYRKKLIRVLVPWCITDSLSR